MASDSKHKNPAKRKSPKAKSGVTTKIGTVRTDPKKKSR